MPSIKGKCGAIYGITRIDQLGRTTIPADMRRNLQISPGDKVSVHFEDGYIYVRTRKVDEDSQFAATASLDKLGRITIPVAFRRLCGIDANETCMLCIDEYIIGKEIRLKIYNPANDIMTHILAAQVINRQGYDSDNMRSLSIAIDEHLNAIAQLIKEYNRGPA